MMKDVSKIIEEYRNCAYLHWKASREGDNKTANKNYTKLTKIFKQMLCSEELSETLLGQLLNDNSYVVQMWAAAHSLGLGKYRNDAVAKLEFISKLSANDAPSFEAKMILQEWKDKGILTF